MINLPGYDIYDLHGIMAQLDNRLKAIRNRYDCDCKESVYNTIRLEAQKEIVADMIATLNEKRNK